MRARERGVTLIEVLIVVAIMALVSAGVAAAAIKYWAHAQRKTAKTDARTLRGSVKAYWVLEAPEHCPTVDELVSAGHLDKDSTRHDPWGEPWRIECTEGDVTVTSAGPDRKPETEDDIRIPPRSS